MPTKPRAVTRHILLSNVFVAAGVLLFAVAPPAAYAQSDALWSGQVQCQVAVQSDGYAHQEIQTWKLTGAPPTMSGAIQVYPANWSVTGQGNTQRMIGVQALRAMWQTSVPPTPNATVAIFIRASDNRLVIKSYHAQLYAPAAITGTRLVAVSGGAPTQSTVQYAAYEWQFPLIEDSPTSTNVSGSGTIVVGGSYLPMQSASSSSIANCSWQFTKGGGGTQAVPAIRTMTTQTGGAPVVTGVSASAPTASVTKLASQPQIPIATSTVGSTTPTSSATVPVTSAGPAVQAAPTTTTSSTASIGGTRVQLSSDKLLSSSSSTGSSGTPPPSNTTPAIAALNPFAGAASQTLDVSLTGNSTHWVQGVTTADFGLSLVKVNRVTVTDSTHATVNVTLPSLPQATGTGPGGLGLTVRLTSNAEVAASNPNAFVIMPPQTLASVMPTAGGQGQTATVDVTAAPGTGFSQGLTADFGDGITVAGVNVVSAGTARLTLNISPTATQGTRNVTVTSAPFVESLANAFTVVAPSSSAPPPPSATRVITTSSPIGATASQTLDVKLTGDSTHWVPGATTADFGGAVTVNSVTVSDATHATVNITLASLPPYTGSGPASGTGFTVRMTSNGEVAATSTNTGFLIFPPMTLASVMPTAGGQGQTATVDVTAASGTGFSRGLTADFGDGITVAGVNVISANTARLTLNISPTASLSTRNVTVTSTPFVESLANAFTVVAPTSSAPPPALATRVITGVSPPYAASSQTLDVNLTGDSTHWVQGATTADFGLSIITVNSVTVTDATHATVNLTLPALTQYTGSSPGGAVGLTVRMTSNGEIAASNPNAFQILPPQKLTSVTPASGTQGQTALVELTANPAMPFQQGMTVDFGSGITVSSFQPSGNIAFINISIASNASPGPRTVTVTSNPFVQTAIDGFTVVAASP